MQEKIENGMVTLIVRCTELSAKELKQAARDYIGYRQRQNEKESRVKHVGEKKASEIGPLRERNDNLDFSVRDSTGDMKDFKKTARKYGVDYASREYTSDGVKQYIISFGSDRRENIDKALAEYSMTEKGRFTKDGREKISVISKLKDISEKIKNEKTKIKEKITEHSYER